MKISRTLKYSFHAKIAKGQRGKERFSLRLTYLVPLREKNHRDTESTKFY